MNNVNVARSKASTRPATVAIALAALGFLGCTTPPSEEKTAAEWQEMCSACHGPDGKSVSARAPILAGQQRAYIVTQLEALRDHSRHDAGARAFMWPMAAGLDDSMIESLASHFSSLAPPPPEEGAGTVVADGKALYEAGPCSSCHGANGQGMAPFPRLAGQHADYVSAQLVAYADGSRPNPVMGPMAKTLTPKQAQSVAAYLATQR
jgi:cytochrome c553